MKIKALKLILSSLSYLFPRHAGQWLAIRFFQLKETQAKAWETTIPEADEVISVHGNVRMRRWGSGTRKIILVHGWEGRFSQFAVLIPKLLSLNFEIYALDPPGHGLSGNIKSDPVQFGNAIKAAAIKLGKPEAIVGHSMGAIGAILALNDGAETDKVVLISLPASVEHTLRTTTKNIGFSDAATRFFINEINLIVGKKASDLDARKLACHRGEKALFLHDKADPQTPFQHSQEVFSKWQNSQFILTSGLGHNRILSSDDVCNTIVEFLQKEHMEIEEKASRSTGCYEVMDASK